MGQRTHRGYRLPNYTQIANDLIDSDMLDMNEAELKITLVLFRDTIGWHRMGPVPLSVQDLIKRTGIQSETTIRAAVKSGINRGTIIEAGRGERGVKLYTLGYFEPLIESDTPPSPADAPDCSPPQNLRGSKFEGDQNLRGTGPATSPKSEGVQGKQLKKGSLKKEDSSIDGTAVDASAPNARSENQPAPRPKKLRESPERKCPGPYQENLTAVSEAISGTPDAFSSRYGAIASWLSGGEQEVDGIPVKGLAPYALPEEIKLFPQWYRDIYPDDTIAVPRTLDKWLEYYPQFRADSKWHARYRRQASRRALATEPNTSGYSAFQDLLREQQAGAL